MTFLQCNLGPETLLVLLIYLMLVLGYLAKPLLISLVTSKLSVSGVVGRLVESVL